MGALMWSALFHAILFLEGVYDEAENKTDDRLSDADIASHTDERGDHIFAEPLSD